MLSYFILLALPSLITALYIPRWVNLTKIDNELTYITKRAPNPDWAKDLQPVDGYNNFWVHESCYKSQDQVRVAAYKDALQGGREMIPLAYEFVKSLHDDWDKEEKKDAEELQSDPTLDASKIQPWVKERCQIFEAIFNKGRIYKKQEVTNWLANWENMNKLFSTKEPRSEAVMLTCFDNIRERFNDIWTNNCEELFHPDGSPKRRPLASTYYPGLVKTENPKLDFTEKTSPYKDAWVINFCPPVYKYFKTQENMLADLKKDPKKARLGRVDIANSIANIWIHELSHLRFTMNAPESPDPGPYSNQDIMDFAAKDGLKLTYKFAEPNAQFAAWCKWKKEKKWNYMSWDGGQADKEAETELQALGKDGWRKKCDVTS